MLGVLKEICVLCRGMASLATMDIFAGCGGLSCGLHKAGAAETKWSIEYEQPAAEAFKYGLSALHSLGCLSSCIYHHSLA